MEVTIIGVDCATQPNKVGLALGRWEDGEARIDRVARGSQEPSIAELIRDWADDSDRTLLALDAPLGWPADLGSTLVDHTAGNPIAVLREDLFRRQTDKSVKCATGKRPLDVGANLIAHTAHAALKLLQEVRELTGEAIPLAWDRNLEAGIHAIEVYPAATLAAYGVPTKGYKKRKEGLPVRRKLIDFLAEHLRLPEDTSTMEDNADALDAGICVLAAVDFLLENAVEPKDTQMLQLARKEGWIWVLG
jgi:predicted RNase H-like nuclease